MPFKSSFRAERLMMVKVVCFILLKTFYVLKGNRTNEQNSCRFNSSVCNLNYPILREFRL